jgi:hypothetical protein
MTTPPQAHDKGRGAADAAPVPTPTHQHTLRIGELGPVVITPRAIAALMRQSVSPIHLLRRHCWGRWGEVTAEDKRRNAQAVRCGTGRVFSRYSLPSGQVVYVITEGTAEYRGTTVLLDTDY